MKVGEDLRHVKGGDFVIFPMIFDTLDQGVQGVNFEGSFFGPFWPFLVYCHYLPFLLLKTPGLKRFFCFLGSLFTVHLFFKRPLGLLKQITCSCLLFDLLTLEVNRECL